MNDIMQTGVRTARDEEALRLVTEALRERPYRPVDLLKKLEERGVSEVRLKGALDALLNEHRVELSPDRHITLREDEPAPTR